MASVRELTNTKPGTVIQLAGTLTINSADNIANELISILSEHNLTIDEALKTLNQAIFWSIFAASLQNATEENEDTPND